MARTARSTPAPCPNAGDAGTVVYDAAVFAAFAPQTAADMIDRAPGFSPNEADQRRGFAGTGANVLLDGVR